MRKEERVVNYVLDARRRAKDSTRKRRQVWEELWTLYQNRLDTSNKEEWQSRCFIPKLFMTVEQAASMVKKAVMRPQQLFSFVPKRKDDSEAHENKEMYEEMLRNELERSNFVNVYSEMIKGAFLLGLGLPKPTWDNNQLTFYNVDIMNAFIDPDYEPSQSKPPRYVIEYMDMDLADLLEMAKSINSRAGKQIYKTSELAKIEEDYKHPDNNKKYERRGLKEPSSKDNNVGLTYFWGGIVSEDKKKVDRNQLVVIANDKYVIRQQDNPFLHQRPPYIPTVPLVYPHRGVAGVSLVEPMVSMQYAYNNIFNLLIDNLNWSVNKAFEVNINNVLNPQNLTQLYPGKLIKKGTSQDALSEVPVTNVGNDVFNTLKALTAEIEKGTAITEFLMGASGTSKTATEAQLKTSQAQGLFNVISRDIERNSLEPLLEMCVRLLTQYRGWSPAILERYKLEVGGLTLLLKEQEKSQNVGEVLMASLESPELRKMTDISELYKKYLDTKNLSEVFTKKPQQPTLEHSQQIQQKAAEDAKNDVAQMTPEEKRQAIQRLGVGNEENRSAQRESPATQSRQGQRRQPAR